MTREHAKALLPFIQAYAEGRMIQHRRSPNHEWCNALIPNFASDPECYRIKPEPREWTLYRADNNGPYITTTTDAVSGFPVNQRIRVREIID